MEVKVTRMFADAEGETHFEDTKISLQDVDGFIKCSNSYKTSSIIFAELYNSKLNDWHNVPRRQFLMVIEGKAEFGVSDGEKRVLGPGDILLAEDITGKGHTRILKGRKPQKVALIALDNN